MLIQGKSSLKTWIEVILFYLGILIFTYFITGGNSSILIALSGIGLSFVLLVFRLNSPADLAASLGFNKLSKRSLIYLGISVLAGLLLGILYRQHLKLGILPSYLVSFAIIGHAIFDIIVYGDNIIAPWWIWS
jgi:hypothetical protein